MVAITDDDKILVGRKALCQAEQNPESTIYDAKRFIGKVFTEEQLATEAARYPFKVGVAGLDISLNLELDSWGSICA